jgi:hypothetical protein
MPTSLSYLTLLLLFIAPFVVGFYAPSRASKRKGANNSYQHGSPGLIPALMLMIGFAGVGGFALLAYISGEQLEWSQPIEAPRAR